MNAKMLAKLRQQYGPEKAEKMFNAIYPVNDTIAPTSIMSGETAGQTQQPDTEKQVSQAAIEAGSKISKQRKEFETAAHELGLPLKVGSNAMVVGPKKSKSGNAMVFGGPQVGLSAPGFFYEVGLHAPGFDIEGSSFVGYPFIMFGATKEMSFTATAGYGNVVDIFSEKLNPKNPHQHFYKGKWRNMKKRIETFDVQQTMGKRNR